LTRSERWFSRDLKLAVMSKVEEGGGVRTFKIENLSRTPPDRSLFLPPPDYTVVDEQGGFTITYEIQ